MVVRNDTHGNKQLQTRWKLKYNGIVQISYSHDQTCLKT